MSPRQPVAPANREAWLHAAVDSLRPLFTQLAGVELPESVHVSVGWPGGKSVRKVIGQCWPTAMSDGVAHVFISPVLVEPVIVLATLVHELVHVVDDCKSGHKAAFGRIARAMGLTGKMTATVASDELAQTLKVIAAELGEYPHKGIKLGAEGVKVQTTRMLKVECAVDGYIVRMTRKWLDDMGTPTCPCGERMDEVV